MTAIDLLRVAFSALDLVGPWLRVHLLRLVVLAASTGGTFTVLGVLQGAFVAADPAAAVLLAGGTVLMAFGACVSWRPGFLQLPSDVSFGRAAVAVALRTVAGYVALVPLAALTAALAVWPQSAWGDPQARVFVGLFALWAPLCWAPAVGPVWAWRRDLRRARR